MKPSIAAPLSLLAPFLAGCHLFSFPSIDKTCEDFQACPGQLDTTETQETAEPGPVFSLGVVVGAEQDGGVVLTAHAADGSVLAEVTGALAATGDVPGAVAYDPDNALFYVADETTWSLVVLGVDGSSRILSAAAQPTDIYVEGGKAYVATTGALYRYDPSVGELDGTLLGTASFAQLDSVFPAYTDNVFLVDLGGTGGVPSLYRGSLVDGTSALVYETYDDGQSRSQDGFQGPEQMPYTCSLAAGVYSVATLDGGLTKDNVAFPDAAAVEAVTGSSVLSDVVDCGWDTEARLLLFVSRSWGVFSMVSGTEETPGKELTHLWAPPEGQSYFRGAFFPSP